MSSKKFERRVDALRQSVKISPKGLIGIIYGDMLVPHGGTVWLGSLVNLAGHFGVVEYLARTSALRLVQDGWLHPTRIGKLSFYSMTEEHVARVKKHYPRVYGQPFRDWSGTWYLLLAGVSGLDRKGLGNLWESLRWHGVGRLSPDIFVSAAENIDAVDLLLQELDLREKIEVMRAESILPKDETLLRGIVEKAWDIDHIGDLYDQFLARFRPLWLDLDGGVSFDGKQAFMLRALLISEYRAVALQDPRLPKELLPDSWAGAKAFTLCRNMYQLLLPASEAFLQENVRTADGPMGEAGDLLYQRFGGLNRVNQPG